MGYLCSTECRKISSSRTPDNQMSINKPVAKFVKKSGAVFLILLALMLSGDWLVETWLGPQVVGFVVVKENLIHGIKARGRIEAPERIEITSKVGGNIASIPVAEGKAVRAGQTLIVLESKEARAAFDKTRIATRLADAKLMQVAARTQSGSDLSLLRAQNTLSIAKKQYDRARELSAKGFVSQEQLGDALRNLAIAQNQWATAQFQARANRAKGSDYQLAEAALNKARVNERAAAEKLSNTVIKAAEDGILITRFVEQGSAISPDKTLMLISPAEKTQLIVQMDEKSGQYLNLGQPALITADSHPGQRINAKVGYLTHATDKTPAHFEAKLDIEHPPEYLRRDMPATAEIVFSRRDNALSIPVAAIRDATGTEPWVMLIENGRTQRRKIKIGMVVDGKVEILDGLREGDFVLPVTEYEVEEGKRMRLAKI